MNKSSPENFDEQPWAEITDITACKPVSAPETWAETVHKLGKFFAQIEEKHGVRINIPSPRATITPIFKSTEE